MLIRNMALISLKPAKWEYAELTTPPQVEGADWTPCKHFPTEIHWELLDAGKIPDWNVGRAEHDVQWVSKRTWAFRSVIDLSGVDPKGKKVEIEFESLDTFATVYLVGLLPLDPFFHPRVLVSRRGADNWNGKEILKADNHFLIHLIPLPTTTLKEVNDLLIIFHPPEEAAQAISDKHGPFQGGSVNLGAKLRMGVRKAQYGFRWDWGPEVRQSHTPRLMIAIDHGT
jgi:beta-mannosidase